jgi:hypothetical protein
MVGIDSITRLWLTLNFNAGEGNPCENERSRSNNLGLRGLCGISCFAALLVPPLASNAAGVTYPANIEYDPSGYGTYNQGALTNPNIGAVDINLNWSTVEPEQGTFNFVEADSEVAAWVSHGKKVTLELRFQHEADEDTTGASCTSDGWIPAWEVARIPTFCDTDAQGGLLIPDYFSQTFQSDWQAYVQAVANHFAQYSTSVIYVRIALGLGCGRFPSGAVLQPQGSRL